VLFRSAVHYRGMLLFLQAAAVFNPVQTLRYLKL